MNSFQAGLRASGKSSMRTTRPTRTSTFKKSSKSIKERAGWDRGRCGRSGRGRRRRKRWRRVTRAVGLARGRREWRGWRAGGALVDWLRGRLRGLALARRQRDGGALLLDGQHRRLLDVLDGRRGHRNGGLHGHRLD